MSNGLLAGFLDLIFAPVCLGCENRIPTAEKERLICKICWSRARPLPVPRCARCWHPRLAAALDAGRCSMCDEIPPGIRVVRSCYVFQGAMRQVVHALKYGGWEAVAEPVAARMAKLQLPPDVREEATGIVSVPTSAMRQRERGYNQAARIAKALARITDRECLDSVLYRSASAKTQTTLHPRERRANVATAFSVPSGRERVLHGRHLLLVDDVLTTGATAAACAEVLLQAGARAVSVLTFARSLPDLERGTVGAAGMDPSATST